MSAALDILRAYRAPAEVQRRRMAGPPAEPRALAVLMVGCGLMFAAQLPRLAREAHLDATIPLEARLGAALLGWVLIMPLVLYGLAGVVHLVARVATGTRLGGYRGRIALFWAVLAAAPLWLLNGLFLGFLGRGPVATVSGFVAMAAFCVFWGVGLRAAYRRPEGAE